MVVSVLYAPPGCTPFWLVFDGIPKWRILLGLSEAVQTKIWDIPSARPKNTAQAQGELQGHESKLVNLMQAFRGCSQISVWTTSGWGLSTMGGYFRKVCSILRCCQKPAKTGHNLGGAHGTELKQPKKQGWYLWFFLGGNGTWFRGRGAREE